MKAKNRLRLHSYLGILSILFLSFRIFLSLVSFPSSVASSFSFLISTQEIALLSGKIGIVLGLFAFLTGAGLGKYMFVQNSEYTEIHIILLLAGLALQIPSISENHSNFYANLVAWISYPLLIAGWIYGRRIRRKRK
ncbi:hypothetical protein [Leptospira kmetyi]|uniref:Lipoprotein n=1 Tax=Leptospira kmetyi TaxID=408139 RepID=A0A2M9XK61_9LEPT|nr:hypothetical protein [Leptospira kmetyi]AYV54977.1 hypothetical protein EFP84_05255 [Leptospira kmetyi]EQA52351.1 hypothetical protein LEP1GSC052_2383 [Leptospira kmetyi serovar Malaysia str. Bejo-Iso9]PJZ29250.1 hypothetical protein CH378_13975 [Leptospira kmetyi]PJZ39628.1 hypothetical protein CH370_20160 [Leptospira kmetyi]TGK19610.1 hypothetical protein EHO62_06435 [Leptospira kmetyi]